jgi:hypothetical protein
MRRWIAVLLTPAPFVSHALSGCSSEETTNDAGDVAIVDAPPRDVVPPFHRPVAIDCDPSRPAGDPIADLDSGDCTSDQDCDAGLNGRCIGVTYSCSPCQTNLCSYDVCMSDDACAGRACVCREAFPKAGNTPDFCNVGDCRVDTDCPSGFCSPSFLPGCTPGYFCRTAADECISDIDCKDASSNRMCAYDSAKKHWTCQGQCVDS